MRGALRTLSLLLMLAAAAAAVVTARAVAENAPSSVARGEKELNLHRHAVGLRVGRAPLPGGGVRLRVIPLPLGTPDVRERLKPTHGTLQDGSGTSLPLQMQADGTLEATVPAAWLQGGVPHQVEVEVWAQRRRVFKVEAGYLLP